MIASALGGLCGLALNQKLLPEPKGSNREACQCQQLLLLLGKENRDGEESQPGRGGAEVEEGQSLVEGRQMAEVRGQQKLGVES